MPATKKVQWGVVHEIPYAPPYETMPALINLRCLDDLFLQCCRNPPIHHVARALLLVCRKHEASIVWPKTRGEHACAPRPPCPLQLLWFFAVKVVVNTLDVLACMHGRKPQRLSFGLEWAEVAPRADDAIV